MNAILVTGGSGFIGSNFLNRFVPRFPNTQFINVDNLSYAANPLSTSTLDSADNYLFEEMDICDAEGLSSIFEQYRPHRVIHFAAETHVDRSITGPDAFVRTNVLGTFTLLETCRKHFTGKKKCRLIHISTDEVFGSLGDTGCFAEDARYDPSSPYSASKAGADHLVRAAHRTFGLPTIVIHASNNYGPYQNPEKFMPRTIICATLDRPVCVYGKGENVRDWLYVQDHCDGIWTVAEKGNIGATYNISGGTEKTNLEVAKIICDTVAEATGKEPSEVRSLITFITDRPGHDFRYALKTEKIRRELGWQPAVPFSNGIRLTVAFYLNHPEWIEQCK